MHRMKVSAVLFEKIRTVKKVIESRLYDEKRQQISVGDTIEISEHDHPEMTMQVEVRELLRYSSFKEMFDDNPLELFGGESREFLLDEIKQFYRDEEEQANGVVGVRFERIG